MSGTNMPRSDKWVQDSTIDSYGRDKSSKNSRQGHAAAWTAAIAGVIGTIFTVLAFIYGNAIRTPDDSTHVASPEGPAAESSTTEAPSERRVSELYSEEETRLGRRITPTSPSEANLSCQPSGNEDISGALAVLECSPRGVQFPIKAIAASFSNRDNLDAFMNNEAGHIDSSAESEAIADDFLCPRDDTLHNAEGVTIGRLICYPEGDRYTIVWSLHNDAYVDKYNEVFAVKAWSVDQQALAEWWQNTPV
jgi:hypothetical protein